MLLIEHIDISETVEIGNLFEQIGFSKLTKTTDNSGDSFIDNEWPIEVQSLDGFYQVEGFRWTKPESQVRLFTQNSDAPTLEGTLPFLQCSPEHIVFRCNPNPGWVKVCDLSNHDEIVTKFGKQCVVLIENVNQVERLCDMQVAIAHSYFTNNILSHNSHFLTMLGANALRQGIDVLHYTFELSETAIGVRYDSNLCDLDSNLVIDSKDDVLKQYESMKLGRLMIKEYPANTASIYTLRSHLERLDLKGFKPGLVLIDYADIMRSTRQFDSLRHELKLVYEELRGLASEKAFPIWTASQANKEGSTTDIVDLNNMSEAYGKAMVADVVLSISRRSHEKASGHGRLYVAKNRAGKDGLVFNVNINTARSKFVVTGDETTPQQAASDDEAALKARLRQKWDELKAETKQFKDEEKI